MAVEKIRKPSFLFAGAELQQLAVRVLWQGAALLMGAVLVQARFAGGLFAATAPFAIAAAAAGAAQLLAAQIFGGALGCLLLLPYPQNVTVMAATAAAGLGNLALRRIGLRQHWSAPFLAAACAAASGGASLLAGDAFMVQAVLPRWLFLICGSVFAGCCAYFIAVARGIRAVQLPAAESAPAVRPAVRLHVGRQEVAALLICAAMPLCALAGYAPGGFVPAHIPAILLVLAAAYSWQETGGAAAGACIGGAMVLAGGAPALAGVFAIGGLLAGVFSRSVQAFEKPSKGLLQLSAVPVAGGFALVCVFYAVIAGNAAADPTPVILFCLECLAAIAVFIAIPGKAWARLRQLFASPVEQVSPAANESGLRLRASAGAMRRVAGYVEEVAAGLSQLGAPVEQSVCAQAEASACRACPRHGDCWERNAAQTTDFFAAALRQLRETLYLEPAQLEQLWNAREYPYCCARPATLCAALGQAHQAYAIRMDCYQKAASLRQAAAEQFNALAGLLEEMGVQLERCDTFENEIAEAAARVLEGFGYRVRTASCVRAASGGGLLLSVAAKIPDDAARGEALLRAICRVTGVAFGNPAVTALCGGDESSLLFAQRPSYHMNLGAVQMSSSESAYCGDYFDCFEDGRGREVLILSDGMGTGGRAAVDSALATEIFSSLARSGLSSSAAVRMANAALLVKSCEESLATIDAATVDLYTGEVEFCKAGGAVSFLRKEGKAERVELSALPAGILRNIHPATASTQIAAGDVVVLVSDGMLGESDDWLCEALAGWTEGAGDMQALAEHLAALSVARRGGSEREDDLTVICARLNDRRDIFS
ncbi:MAG: serine/threonine-protein phosphatase [Oscillospiraceae bacterium]|jgi:stage II sporulation protein E|nr:serine/threonine-protein phosphatase [Oscillospiraceae bacterium]